jgi:phosphatidate cytidylyltransferase
VSGELARRVAVAAVGIPVALACLAAGGWILGALVAVASALGAWEFYRLARADAGRPFAAVGVVAAAGVVLFAVRLPDPVTVAPAAMATLVGLCLALFSAAVWARGPQGHPMRAVAGTVTGVIYVGGTLAFVPMLRAVPLPGDHVTGGLGDLLRPATFVLLPLVATWVGDAAAYFVGKGVGRRKLAPHASPAKTVEGALAGLAGSGLAGAAIVAWALTAPVPGLTALSGAWMGVVVGAAGQVGDLAESVLKREAGVKDSGALLPGHGGALDRLDALLFAFPVTWALLTLQGLVP